MIDEDEITIIEIKQLLRRYGINATGKKTLLMDRIRRLQQFLGTEVKKHEDTTMTHQAAEALVGAQDNATCP